MIKKYLIFGLFSINIACFCAQSADFKQFIKILGVLESNNNDFAIGDNKKSISRYQIQLNCYLDAKKYDKTIDFPYKSLTNEVNARKVVKAYLFKYGPNGDFETWARLWNSGPNWKNKKEKTNKYYNRFVKILHSQ
jgi:hypothetical protein